MQLICLASYGEVVAYNGFAACGGLVDGEWGVFLLGGGLSTGRSMSRC